MLELNKGDFWAAGIPNSISIKSVSTEEKMLNEIYLARLAKLIRSQVDLDGYKLTEDGVLSYLMNFHCYRDFFHRNPNTESMLGATGFWIKDDFYGRLHLIVERIAEMKSYVDYSTGLGRYNNFNKHRRHAMRYEYNGGQ